jgi:hypothetical protein
VKTPDTQAAFEASVAKWMETRVAKHKFLRGGMFVPFSHILILTSLLIDPQGVAVIDVVPKR